MNEREKLFEEIITPNFPNLMKNINPQTQENSTKPSLNKQDWTHLNEIS
jgi:hypothetical protein